MITGEQRYPFGPVVAKMDGVMIGEVDFNFPHHGGTAFINLEEYQFTSGQLRELADFIDAQPIVVSSSAPPQSR